MIANTHKHSSSLTVVTFTIVVFFLVPFIFFIIHLDYTLKSGFIILPFVVMVAYFYLLQQAEKKYTQYYIFSFLVLLIIYSFVLHYIEAYTFPKDSIFTYTPEGVKVAKSLREFNLPNFSKTWMSNLSRNAYILWNGLVFTVIGESYYGMQIINSLFLALAVFNITRLFKVLYDRELPKIALIGLFLYPSFYWFGVTNLRESPSLFFITGSIYHGAKWLIKNEIHPLKLALFTVGVFLTRSINLGFILVFFGLILFSTRISIFFKKLTPFRLSTLISLILVISIALLGEGFYNYAEQKYTLERVHSGTTRRAESGYTLAPRDYDTWANLLKNVPLAGLQFLTIPAPWTFAIGHTKAYIDALYVSFVLLISLFGFPMLWRERKYFTFALSIFIILTTYTYGIVDISAGSAARHRMQFVPLLFIFVGRVFLRKRSKILAKQTYIG